MRGCVQRTVAAKGGGGGGSNARSVRGGRRQVLGYDADAPELCDAVGEAVRGARPAKSVTCHKKRGKGGSAAARRPNSTAHMSMKFFGTSLSCWTESTLAGLKSPLTRSKSVFSLGKHLQEKCYNFSLEKRRLGALDKHRDVIRKLLQLRRVFVFKEMHNNQPQPALVLDDVLRRLGKHLQVRVLGEEDDLPPASPPHLPTRHDACSSLQQAGQDEHGTAARTLVFRMSSTAASDQLRGREDWRGESAGGGGEGGEAYAFKRTCNQRGKYLREKG